MGRLTIPIIKIGNSKGIRLPKLMLEQYGLTSEVNFEQTDEGLLLRPSSHVRDTWDKLFKKHARPSKKADVLFGNMTNDWDRSQWQW